MAITGGVVFCLGAFVLLKNIKREVNVVFACYSFSIVWWCFTQIGNVYGPTLGDSWFWARIEQSGVVFIPTFFIHFVIAFLDLRKKRKILIPCYIFSALFALLFPTNLLARAAERKFGGINFGEPGVLYPFLIVYFVLGTAYGLYELFKRYRVAKGNLKNQLKYLCWSSLLGYFGGSASFLLVYDISIPVLNPFGTYLVAFYVFATAYTIVSYRLMEIELVIKRTLIFAGVFAFIFAVFAGMTFFTQEFLVTLLGDNTRYATFLFSVLLITLGIRPLERFLVNITDNILFQRKYDYQKTLKEASEGMALITDMKKLLNLIARIVSKSIRVKSAAIFQLDEEKNKYVLRIRRGSVRRHGGYSLGKDNALVWWLGTHKEAILLDEVEDWLRSERFLRKQKGLKDKLFNIKEEIVGMDGAICVPSYSKGHLIGFLVLGEKLSGDIYTQQDIHLLSTLASEAAIAVENAKNFMEVEKLREKERESYIQTVLALAQTVDEKDSYTRGHLEDVNYYGMRVAEELEQSSEFKAVIDKEDLDTSLHLHDIGKVGVPDAILHKNGKLTAPEWEIMKQHCEIGARIVEPIAKLKNVGNIIKHHQEKYDGTGYPDGLKGEEIPLEARIISVVDAYHAMVSDRPYRKAFPEEVALGELRNNVGTQFDPIVVAAFVRAWERGKIKKI